MKETRAGKSSGQRLKMKAFNVQVATSEPAGSLEKTSNHAPRTLNAEREKERGLQAASPFAKNGRATFLDRPPVGRVAPKAFPAQSDRKFDPHDSVPPKSGASRREELNKNETSPRAEQVKQSPFPTLDLVPPPRYALNKSILEKIWLERLRQKQLLRAGKFLFACDSPIVNHDRKLRALTGELGEVAAAIDQIEILNPLRQPRAGLSVPSARARQQLRDELAQVAAVAIAWLESLEGNTPLATNPPPITPPPEGQS